MKYTPGPWYATRIHVQSAAKNEDNYVCEAEGSTVAQAKANAKLIAAAPEMWALLQDIRDGAFEKAGGSKGVMLHEIEMLRRKIQ